MNTTLLTVLRQIVSQHGGVETLSDARRVKALLADLAAKEPKPQKNALTVCLEQGFAALLQNVLPAERGSAKAKLAERLNRGEGLEAALCADTLDLLEAALFGDVSTRVEPKVAEAPKAPAPPCTYYLSLNYQQSGPFTLEQLTSMIGGGRMSKEYWIRPDDKTDWSPITALPELKPFFADTAAPGQKPTAVSPGRQDREVWRELRTLKGHTRQVNSVTYSPDGRRIVSGPAAGIFRDDGTIRICDAESGQILQTLEEHVGVIWFVAYSPDGRRIVSGPGSTIRIWDAENGRLLHTLETSGWGHPMAYSPDGRRIAFGSILYRTIKIWGVE